MAKVSEASVGAVFGKLTVVSDAFPVRSLALKSSSYVNCECACGSGIKSFQVSRLGTKIKSCGCLSDHRYTRKPSDYVYLAHDKHGVMTLEDAVNFRANGKPIPSRYKGKPLAFVFLEPGWDFSTYRQFLTKVTEK